MAESLWHFIGKCSWSMQDKVWRNIHVFVLIGSANISVPSIYMYMCIIISVQASIDAIT